MFWTQYLRKEMLEKSLIPTNIDANTLEQSVMHYH